MTTPMATGWQQVGQFTPLNWTLRPTSGSITAAVGELVRASAANGSIDIAPPSNPQDGGSILIIRTDSVVANVVRFTGPTNGASELVLDRQWSAALLTYDATNTAWLRTALAVHHHDERYVGLGGDQEVGGVKTFISGVRVPQPSDAANPVRHDDARLANARTPTTHASTHATGGSDPITPGAIGAATSGHSHALAAHKSTHATGGSDALAPADIGAATASHAHAIGDLPVAASGASSATALVRADDARLSNARTPAAHKASHVTGGADALAPSDIGAAAASHSHAIGDLPVASSGASSATALVRADDARLSNARTPTSHSHAIADLPVATSGTSSATALVRADDSRLSDARTPTAHSHAIGDLPVAASGASSSTALVRADDARLSNARTPSTHASTHASGGADPLAPADIGAASASHSHALTAHASTHGSAGSDPLTPAAIGAAAATHSHSAPIPSATAMSVASGTATPQATGGAQLHRLSTGASVTVALPSGAVDCQPLTYEITNSASSSITITLDSGYEIGGTGRTRSIVIAAGKTSVLFSRMRTNSSSTVVPRLLSVDDGG